MVSKKEISVGLVGAGYIASWHAEAIARSKHARLVGVCDTSSIRASGLADKWGVPSFSTIDQLKAETDCQSVHILVPPGLHAQLASDALTAGLHCFVEKPLTPTEQECQDLVQFAEMHGRVLGVNHNFLFLPSAEKMHEAVASQRLGPLRRLDVQWSLTLPQIDAGPHGRWPFDTPAQPLIEVGAHALAFAKTLAPDFELTFAEGDDRRELTLGRWCYRRWVMLGRSGTCLVSIVVDLGATAPAMRVQATGLGGVANLDFQQDLYVESPPAAAGVVFGPLTAGNNVVRQIRKEVRTNAFRQLRSLDKLAPFGLSLTRSIDRFYQQLTVGGNLDFRHSPELASSIAGELESVSELTQTSRQFSPPVHSSETAHSLVPKVLVTGGTGFIGRQLVQQLIDSGVQVRVLTRGGGEDLRRSHPEYVQITKGDLSNTDNVRAALEGIEQIVHLARGDGKSWEDYQRTDVMPTRQLGQLAAERGVQRFVYTGTIDSYASSNPKVVIDDSTPVDAKIGRRNLYARAKAAGETELRGLAESQQLPLVITRPGIVIGGGGSPAHWGVGMWFSPTTCRLWGTGNNPLPLVLVEDVAAGLKLSLEHPAAVGQTFLLTGPPLLTARQYVDAYQRSLQAVVDCKPRSMVNYYGEDMVKFLTKRLALKPVLRPSFHDWSCRAHRAQYRAEFAEKQLGWRPTKERAKLVERGIQLPVRQLMGHGQS